MLYPLIWWEKMMAMEINFSFACGGVFNSAHSSNPRAKNVTP